MSSTGTNVARKIVADALHLNWSGLEVAFAVRCTIGIAIPLIAGELIGQPLDGASAAYGALVTGLASRQGVYRTRVAAMLTASAVLAVSGYAGAITGPHPVANIALLAVWALVFGIIASIGRAAIVVSVNACVAFVLFSNAPYDVSHAGFHGLMIFAGGALQMLLLVLIWPLGHFRAERAALGAAYTVLSEYAVGLRAADLGLPDTQSVAAVGAALADPQPFGARADIAAYQALADEAERLRATLAALATEQHLLNEVGLTAAGDAVRVAARASGPLLDAVAAALSAGRDPAAHDAEMHAFDAAVRTLERTASPDAPCVADAHALAGQLRAALRTAAAAAHGGLAVDGEPQQIVAWIDVANLRSMGERLLANFSWSSTYARHAVRLSLAATVAVIVQHVLPLEHAQWIPLTVILVLRPDFTSTFTRGVGRVAGTVAGAILASLVALFDPADAAYIVLAIVFAGSAFALFNVSYALFSTAITCYVVFLLALAGAPEHQSALDRVVATLIGGLLALIAYSTWPDWTHERVADDLAALIEAQRRFVALVFASHLDGASDERALRTAQVAAWRARSNAEGSVDQMAGEPVRPRGLTLRTASGILAASRLLGIAGLTLHARVERIEAAPHELIDHFAADLDVALRALAEALRNGDTPAAFPPLRDDQIALERALDERGDMAIAALASETDLIVDSVDTIAAVIAKN